MFPKTFICGFCAVLAVYCFINQSLQQIQFSKYGCTANTSHKVKVIYISKLQDGTPHARKTCKWNIQGSTLSLHMPIHSNSLDNAKQSQDR